MGLLIILLACVVVIKIKLKQKTYSGIDAGIMIVALIAGVTSFVLLTFRGLGDNLLFEYSKEERKEVIQLEELMPNDIFVNYSYSSKEYSYKVSMEIRTIDSKNVIVQEKIAAEEEPRIEHYKLKNPKSFWFSYIPWIEADKYIIYMPEKEMISRIP